MKHGTGVFTWPNGEFYKGSFFKDYRHGKGMYSWPDGSKYTGKFYLNRKEGYGVQVFPDGSTFEGLYHADERFGPGVMTYPDGRQDVGLWHRERLLRLCTTLESGFSLEDFPEHMRRLPRNHLKQPQLLLDVESSRETDQGLSEDKDRFILPPDIESYSTDSDHLPIPRCLRRELDLHFFGTSDVSKEQQSPSTALPLQQRMNAHIQRHRSETDALDWDVAAVLNMNRTQFGPKGPLELNSEKLIKEASHGECRNVYRILRDEKVHPDVSDARGHTALIAATVNCHNDVIHILLDNGADVNKLNDEGMSALAVCHVLYYPLQSLHETLAERVTQNISPEPQIKPLEDVSHESSPDPMTETPKDESGQETFETPTESDQADRSLEPENLNNLEKLEEQINEDEIVPQPDQAEEPQPHFQINEDTDPNNEVVLQFECEEDKPIEEPHVIIMSRSIQVFDDKIPVGSVSWREKEAKTVVDTEEEMTDLEIEENLERSIRSDDPTFDSARSMASFHIDVTEEILQKSAEILCQTGTVTPADTQETVRKIALLKTEHRNRWTTIKLLLERGADPNASTVPMPVIFLAIKAAHVKGVRRLLECGARTDIPLLPEQKGLYPLHIAAGLSGAEGPEITELLLHALADPDVKAQDTHEVYEFDKDMFEPQAFKNQHLIASGPLAKFNEAHIEVPQEGGRTPLHVACQRDSDYANARDVVALLLSHNANPNDVWSGHSPLSLAIASGNDLLEKLIKAGADILMPVVVGEGRRSSEISFITSTNYAPLTRPVPLSHQNQRMAHTPYHALNKHERQAYNARRQLLDLMGDLLRQAAIRMEKERSQDVLGVSPAEKLLRTGSGATPSQLSSPEENNRTSFNKRINQRVQRKPRFKYCYECGRSVGVQLLACTRCREVFYCSKTCKTKAWDERHRDECVRVPGKCFLYRV
ncbi:ankyrin repeat and MYND domain-containing 1 [Labeo rohita]|uniref:Ankyrin repeat and MYND domain-containing 1 n=1 Tax=Labeo rohita TaxID=84645 RepID=A0A498MH74_LABRO|nr:ankyrin repeat and MYND domain-containing 1 [Labeo rohita]RXN20481.1 ankyrin repeat and MYND domain-containing 1 [Labeo rohita]